MLLQKMRIPVEKSKLSFLPHEKPTYFRTQGENGHGNFIPVPNV